MVIPSVAVPGPLVVSVLIKLDIDGVLALGVMGALSSMPEESVLIDILWKKSKIICMYVCREKKFLLLFFRKKNFFSSKLCPP